ncbi:MAG: hypothetical protein C0451_14245 [Comamonadaceae bacterium]|nr:hypothetical protein [Comamonadaceae bacterium]
MNNRFFRLRPIPLMLCLSLAACGGGSDTRSASDQTLTLSGTAAVGAAIASAPVAAKCASGDGNATSRADGGFDVTVSGGALPCVLRVTTADGTVLHSVAFGSGNSVRANISPLTDLAVAYLAGAAPSTLWDTLVVDKLGADLVEQAVASVMAVLASVGIDTAAVGNPFTALLVAAIGTTPGNPHDQALDALQTALEGAGLELEDLRDLIIVGAPSAPPAAGSGTPSLPPELLLAARASNCDSLRSGRYRILIARPSGQLGQHAVIDGRLDATTLTFTDDDPTEEAALLIPNGNCRYNTPTGQLVIGPAGVGLLSSVDDGGVARLGVVIPVQSHRLADLAGDWNFIVFGATGAVAEASRGGYNVTSTGNFTSGFWCEPFDNCEVDSPQGLSSVTFQSRADGSFNLKDATEEQTARMQAFRSGGGALMLVGIDEYGDILFMTRRGSLSLPAVDRVNENWSLRVTGALVADSALADGRSTVASVDAASTPQTYLRHRVINAGTGATVPETLAINSPDMGFLHRRPATGVTASDGSTVNVSEWAGLSLTGTGLFPLWSPASNSFSVSMSKPAQP